MKKMKDLVEKFWKDEDGMGTLEIVLIIAVIVIIFIVFKKWIIDFVTNILNGTTNNIDSNNPNNSPTTTVNSIKVPTSS